MIGAEGVVHHPAISVGVCRRQAAQIFAIYRS
jgi:hypothetical protein